MYKRLLVAFDGSEQSYKALDHAVSIAEKFDSKLIILIVVSNAIEPFLVDENFGPIIDDVIFKYQEIRRKLCHNMLKEAEEMISSKHPNLNVQTILLEGRPSATIVDMADRAGCDMVVMGSRDIRGIKGWVLGSTSHRVADSCKTPVLIIK